MTNYITTALQRQGIPLHIAQITAQMWADTVGDVEVGF